MWNTGVPQLGAPPHPAQDGGAAITEGPRGRTPLPAWLSCPTPAGAQGTGQGGWGCPGLRGHTGGRLTWHQPHCSTPAPRCPRRARRPSPWNTARPHNMSPRAAGIPGTLPGLWEPPASLTGQRRGNGTPPRRCCRGAALWGADGDRDRLSPPPSPGPLSQPPQVSLGASPGRSPEGHLQEE